MGMDRHERIGLLEEAQAHLADAITSIREAIRDTENERYCERYILGHLQNWAEGDNGIETTVQTLINDFKQNKIRIDDE